MVDGGNDVSDDAFGRLRCAFGHHEVNEDELRYQALRGCQSIPFSLDGTNGLDVSTSMYHMMLYDVTKGKGLGGCFRRYQL